MEKIKDNLGLIFISLISIVYLYVTCNLIINFDELKTLKLNEKGDFLAGIFSPLAFLWLVYGYLQQGQELKQNTKALKMQAEELRISNESLKQQVTEMSKSVKAQQDMFELANTQHQDAINEKLKLSMPKYIFITSNYEEYKNISGEVSYSFDLTIENLQVPLQNIMLNNNFWMISAKNSGRINNEKIFRHTRLNINESLKLRFYLNITSLVPFNENFFEIKYLDFSNIEYTDKYTIKKLENGIIEFSTYTPHH